MNNYQEDSKQLVAMVTDFIEKYNRDQLLPLIYKHVLPYEDIEKIDRCDESDRYYILKWMGQGATYEGASNTLFDWQLELRQEAEDEGSVYNEEE